MRSIYLTSPHNMEVREEEIPQPSDHEILVRVAYCGICTLEQRLYDGERKISYPIVPGHEASGIIAAVGSKVLTKVSIGDSVVLDLVNRCHACPACLTGKSNLCENRFSIGQRVLGAFSEYIVVKPEQVFTIPSTLPLDQAALTEPLACCIRSIRKTEVSLGNTLFISGAGTMGLLHVKVALAMGVRVIVSDITPARLSAARSMGADYVVDGSNEESLISAIMEFTRGHGVDGAIITTTSLNAVKSAARVLCPGGTLNIYTSYGNEPITPVDLNTIHRNEFVITGTEGREQNDFYTALCALAHRKVVVDDLVTRIYPMEEVTEAVELALSGTTYRILLCMGE